MSAQSGCVIWWNPMTGRYKTHKMTAKVLLNRQSFPLVIFKPIVVIFGIFSWTLCRANFNFRRYLVQKNWNFNLRINAIVRDKVGWEWVRVVLAPSCLRHSAFWVGSSSLELSFRNLLIRCQQARERVQGAAIAIVRGRHHCTYLLRQMLPRRRPLSWNKL